MIQGYARPEMVTFSPRPGRLKGLLLKQIPMPAPEIGAIYAIRDEREDAWFLIQIVAQNKSWVAWLTLDYLSPELPSEEQLATVEPLLCRHFAWNNKPEALFIRSRVVPRRCLRVGRQDPLISEVNAYGRGWPRTSTKARALRWADLPAAVLEAYDHSSSSREVTQLGGRSQPVSSRRLSIRATDNVCLSELHAFGALTTLELQGPGSGLTELLSAKPLVRELVYLDHQREVLELDSSHLEELTLDVGSLKRLVLGKDISQLSFVGELRDLEGLEIVHEQQGKHLTVNLNLEHQQSLPRMRLPRLSGLSVAFKSLELETIARAYPNLESLELLGLPGLLLGANCLRNLKDLEFLRLRDVFGLEVGDLPLTQDLPKLETLILTSVPKAVGQLARKRFRELPELDVTQLRDENWLAENLNNPFRAWGGRPGIRSQHAKKAFQAFKSLHRSLSLGLDQLEDLVSTFVEAFNEMDRTDPWIGSLEREEVGQALVAVAQEFGLDLESVVTVFDQTRDF